MHRSVFFIKTRYFTESLWEICILNTIRWCDNFWFQAKYLLWHYHNTFFNRLSAYSHKSTVYLNVYLVSFIVKSIHLKMNYSWKFSWLQKSIVNWWNFYYTAIQTNIFRSNNLNQNKALFEAVDTGKYELFGPIQGKVQLTHGNVNLSDKLTIDSFRSTFPSVSCIIKRNKRDFFSVQSIWVNWFYWVELCLTLNVRLCTCVCAREHDNQLVKSWSCVCFDIRQFDLSSVYVQIYKIYSIFDHLAWKNYMISFLLKIVNYAVICRKFKWNREKWLKFSIHTQFLFSLIFFSLLNKYFPLCYRIRKCGKTAN